MVQGDTYVLLGVKYLKTVFYMYLHCSIPYASNAIPNFIFKYTIPSFYNINYFTDTAKCPMKQQWWRASNDSWGALRLKGLMHPSDYEHRIQGDAERGHGNNNWKIVVLWSFLPSIGKLYIVDLCLIRHKFINHL